jgi:hypothetical protein
MLLFRVRVIASPLGSGAFFWQARCRTLHSSYQSLGESLAFGAKLEDVYGQVRHRCCTKIYRATYATHLPRGWSRPCYRISARVSVSTKNTKTRIFRADIFRIRFAALIMLTFYRHELPYVRSNAATIISSLILIHITNQLRHFHSEVTTSAVEACGFGMR